MYKTLLLAVIFTLISNCLNSQSLYDLEKCKTYACIDNWLTKWENAATGDLKLAAKLVNKENRQNKCVAILERYAGNFIHYYNNSPRRGPLRTHLRYILVSKDAEENYIDNFFKTYDAAYDRISAVYQESLNGQKIIVPNASVNSAINKIANGNSSKSESKNSLSETDFKKLPIEQQAKLTRVYVGKEKIQYAKTKFTKEQFKKIQKCIGVPEKYQTGEYNAVTRYVFEYVIGIDMSLGFEEYFRSKIEAYCGEPIKYIGGN